MDQNALINAMTAKGHSQETAQATIAGRSGDSLQNLYTEYLGSSGSSGGNATGINPGDIPSTQDFIQGQFAGEDVALNALLDKMGGQESPLDIYTGLEEEAGLPGLKGAASSLTGEVARLEDILFGIPDQVAGTTKESLVTEGQRQDMVQAQGKPFMENLAKVSTALGRVMSGISQAEANIATKVQLAMKGQQMELEPLELKYSVLTDRNARLLSGFTSDQQIQLDVLFDKLQRDRTLDDQEWAVANELATSERNYYTSLQGAAAEAGYQVKGDETISELLGAIGIAASEAIAFGRRDTGDDDNENEKNKNFDPEDPDWTGGAIT